MSPGAVENILAGATTRRVSASRSCSDRASSQGSSGRIRRSGAHNGCDQNLRPDCLFGRSASPRNRNPHGAERRAENDGRRRGDWISNGLALRRIGGHWRNLCSGAEGGTIRTHERVTAGIGRRVERILTLWYQMASAQDGRLLLLDILPLILHCQLKASIPRSIPKSRR